ncbi:MAG: glycosyl transferase family 90 [Tepidisphaeraceae bacterium]
MATVIGPVPPKPAAPPARGFNLLLHWRADDSTFRFEDRGGFQTRNAATTHLLHDSLPIARQQLRHSFSIGILTGDFPIPEDAAQRCFAYCRERGPSRVIAIPDFLFWAWPEVGIHDYESTVEQILQKSKIPPVDERLLWIGNAATHPTRQRFVEMAQKDPRICACPMTWLAPQNARDAGAAWQPAGGFISPADHCQYRFLIDLQGRGFSARLKLLLFTGRPLFVQERRWNEYYFSELQPYVHYIPVREDLSDLISQLDWAHAHPDRCAAIAAEAQRFAQTRLRRRHAVQYLAQRLIECSSVGGGS